MVQCAFEQALIAFVEEAVTSALEAYGKGHLETMKCRGGCVKRPNRVYKSINQLRARAIWHWCKLQAPVFPDYPNETIAYKGRAEYGISGAEK